MERRSRPRPPPWRGPRRLAAGAGLAALLAILAASRGAAPAPPAATQQQRPFLHGDHASLGCQECHDPTRGAAHGAVSVRTARDCAACHHAPERGYTCQSCHAESQLAAPIPVTERMAFTVLDEPVTRELRFDHREHAGLACQECHRTGVMLAADVTCASCHLDHHRPTADCLRCHRPAEADAHTLEVHLGCAGCHTDQVSAQPVMSRNFCLLCHVDQVDHEPDAPSCQGCHMIPDPVTPRGAPPAAAAASRRGVP